MSMNDLYGLLVLFTFVAPITIIVYLTALLLLRPPKAVILASLLGGLLMGLVNVLVDLVAYYAHWWHYTLQELIFHIPIPFYMTPILIYGSMIYLLIWRFWSGRFRWLSRLLLFGVPIFGIVRDIGGAMLGTSYITWDNSAVAVPVIIGMWVVMFSGGYLLFKRLAPPRESGENSVKLENSLS
jgi:hypothetical protein